MVSVPSPPAMWRGPLTVLIATMLALVALFWRDAAHMASIWWNSSTFNHCLVLIPIIGWLVAQRWPALKDLTPQPWWPGLVLVAGGALSWMLGEAAGVALARHLGLVVMLQGAVVTILGLQVARTLLFLIAYALFLVPLGEEFVPALQILTADLAMAMLGWVGIPAHIEGVFITTPHGWFEVAEACSGVKFLIAMVALGALAAHLLFERWGKRIAFMMLAVVVPIVANGIRAFATIWYAESYGVEHAAGFDHIVFGWVFFAAVLTIVLGIGWWWSDREPFGEDGGGTTVQPVDASEPAKRPWLAPAAAVAIAALPLGWLGYTASPSGNAPVAIAAPAPDGWVRQATRQSGWKPAYSGENQSIVTDYADAQGRAVRMAISVFDRQTAENNMVGYGRGVIGEGSGWNWVSSRDYDGGKGRFDHIVSDDGTVRKVAVYYRFADTLTGSKTQAKLLGLKARLLGGNQRAASIMVSSVEAPGANAEHAIEDFIAAAGSPGSLADAAFETR